MGVGASAPAGGGPGVPEDRPSSGGGPAAPLAPSGDAAPPAGAATAGAGASSAAGGAGASAAAGAGPGPGSSTGASASASAHSSSSDLGGGGDASGAAAAAGGGRSRTPPRTSSALDLPAAAAASGAAAAGATAAGDDAIAPHLTRDLPHHILECPLLPGSGRTMRSYRVRHADSGASAVVRAAVVRYLPDDAPRAGAGAYPTESEFVRDVRAQEEELLRIRSLLGDMESHPNVLPFLAWSASSSPARDYRSNLTVRALYLARAHVHSTLGDRLATRPFLCPVEKHWISYQILRALGGMHDAGVCHGHLTCENVGVTSWGWVVLLDMASYKPVSIPGDDPSDFIAHYQERSAAEEGGRAGGPGGGGAAEERRGGHGERQRCYLAPERFYTKRRSKDESFDSYSSAATYADEPALRLTPAMDVFSAGCVLVELYLNGERALDLGDAMELRARGEAPSALRQRLGKIESAGMRAACRHMLHADPRKRLGAAEYLERLSRDPTPSSSSSSSSSRRSSSSSTGGGGGGGGADVDDDDAGETRATAAPIPPCFESALFPLLKRIRTECLSPDARVALCAAHYGAVVRATVGIDDRFGERRFGNVVGRTVRDLERATEGEGAEEAGSSLPPPSSREEKNEGSEKAVETLRMEETAVDALLAETEELLRRLESDALLAEDGGRAIDAAAAAVASKEEKKSDKDDDDDGDDDVPFEDDLDAQFRKVAATWPPGSSPSSPPPSAAALVVFVNVLLSSVRHVQRPPSKLVALLLLSRLSALSTDDVRLQRIVPCAASLLTDADGTVRAEALRTLTSALERIEDFPPSDAQVFPRYVFKRVGPLASDAALPARLAFAECVASLAETARRFLDVSHAKRLYELVGAAEEEAAGKGVAGAGGGARRGADDEAGKPAAAGAASAASPMRSGAAGVGVGGGAGTGMFSDDLADLLGGGGEAAAPPSPSPSPAAAAAAPPSPGAARAEPRRGDGGGGGPPAGSPAAATLVESAYDADLASLRSAVSRWVVQLATDVDAPRHSEPKKVLLRSLPRLASFFGRDGTLAFVLPQALAFLNSRDDAELRAELCRRLPPVCAAAGRAATGQFVVPCVETALADEEERVVAAALGCLARLAGAGLLTRAALLGAPSRASSRSSPSGTDAAGAGAAGERPSAAAAGAGGGGGAGAGAIERCAPLLIHPSAHVRCGAVALVAAACEAVGFPDDEVFVLPLVRPFFRYEPSRDQLRSKKSIKSCLLPPLTRKEMYDEFENLREMSAPGQTPVEIGKDVTTVNQEERADATTGDTEAKRNVLGITLMRQYLRILYRRNRFGNPFENDEECGRSASTVLDSAAVDGMSKLAYSCFVPNQKFAELVKHSLPDWYQTLRQMHAENPSLSDEICSLRSLSSLNQVYGLTVSQPTNSFDPKRSWKGDSAYAFLDMMLDDGIPVDADGSISEDDATSFLSSVESKTFEAAIDGEWGSNMKLDPVLVENSLHATKLRSLAVPPLPPHLGLLREQDGRPFSWHGSFASVSDPEASFRGEWKPKMDALVASSSTTSEHSGAVTRLAVSQDQTFFVSASHDGTSRVWELRQVQDSAGDLRSCLTYSDQCSPTQGSRINDVSIIENSHSVATASSSGSVHVWRVDMVSARSSGLAMNPGDSAKAAPDASKYYERSRVSGSTLVRDIDPKEGEVLAVSHFNTSSSSVVMFGTQKGFVHSWDLRSAKEPFCLKIRPELGYLTSMAVGHDRNWAVAGTNHGCIALFDLRFEKIVNLWQHSSLAPISRMATSSSALPQDGVDAAPSIFVGSGLNEAAAFDLLEGKCRKCFRVLDTDFSYVDHSSLPSSCLSLPTLNELPIPSPSQRRIYSVQRGSRRSLQNRPHTPEPSMLSLMGRMGGSGQNYLITGGSDCFIRYWDFTSPSRCYTVSGLVSSQPRPVYENVETGNYATLFLCRQMPVPRLSEVENSKIPRKLQRGACRPDAYNHRDAILDLKMVEFPMQGLLSCSRDGAVKLWR